LGKKRIISGKGYPENHVKVDANRGRDDTHFSDHDDDETEPDRVIAQAGDQGEENNYNLATI
jgi:hypothetical protein